MLGFFYKCFREFFESFLNISPQTPIRYYFRKISIDASKNSTFCSTEGSSGTDFWTFVQIGFIWDANFCARVVLFLCDADCIHRLWIGYKFLKRLLTEIFFWKSFGIPAPEAPLKYISNVFASVCLNITARYF